MLRCTLSGLSVRLPSLLLEAAVHSSRGCPCPFHPQTAYLGWDLQCYPILLRNPRASPFRLLQIYASLLTAFHLRHTWPEVRGHFLQTETISAVLKLFDTRPSKEAVTQSHSLNGRLSRFKTLEISGLCTPLPRARWAMLNQTKAHLRNASARRDSWRHSAP